MKHVLRLIRMILIALIAFLLGVWSVLALQGSNPPPPTYNLVFEHQPGPDVPTLQVLAAEAGAVTDEEILAAVAAYYDANAERLALLWREDNPTRLAGIFSMYISHISMPYGVTTFPASVAEFLTQERAHCGTYMVPQNHIALALGLTIRTIEFVGEHAWEEVWVDDHWELFDATTNTWMSRTSLELLQGLEREYRYFYTPMLDINHPEARLHLAEGYDMPRLRSRMPLMGIVYFPPGERHVSDPLGPLADQIIAASAAVDAGQSS